MLVGKMADFSRVANQVHHQVFVGKAKIHRLWKPMFLPVDSAVDKWGGSPSSEPPRLVVGLVGRCLVVGLIGRSSD